jgi:hypothetical protein
LNSAWQKEDGGHGPPYEGHIVSCVDSGSSGQGEDVSRKVAKNAKKGVLKTHLGVLGGFARKQIRSVGAS